MARLHLVLAVSIAVASISATGSWAANPLDDDAGTGGDAGDRRPLALAIEPGTIDGRLTNGADETDWYAFDAAAGSVLIVTLEADDVVDLWLYASPPEPHDELDFGTLYGFMGRGEHQFFLPYDGPWFFLIANQASLFHPLTEYSFTFSIDGDGQGVALDGSLGWQTVEARWNQPTDVHVFERYLFPRNLTEPFTAATIWELRTTQGDRVEGGAAYGGGWGRSIIASSSPLPPTELPASAEVPLDDGGLALETSYVGVTHLKLTRFQTGAQAVVNHVHFHAQTTFQSAQADGADVVRWSDSNSGAANHLQAPGVSVVGPRDFLLNVDDHFVGFFAAHNAQNASIQRPDGSPQLLNEGCACTVLGNITRGEWRFHLGSSHGAGPAPGAGLLVPAAEKNYLAGVFVPELGTYPT